MLNDFRIRKLYCAGAGRKALHTCKPTHAIHIQPFAWLAYIRPCSKDRSTQCCRMAGNSGMLPDSYACYVSHPTLFHTTCRLPRLTDYIHAGGNFARFAELPCVGMIASRALDEQAGNGSRPKLAILYDQEILVNIADQCRELNFALYHGRPQRPAMNHACIRCRHHFSNEAIARLWQHCVAT